MTSVPYNFVPNIPWASLPCTVVTGAATPSLQPGTRRRMGFTVQLAAAWGDVNTDCLAGATVNAGYLAANLVIDCHAGAPMNDGDLAANLNVLFAAGTPPFITVTCKAQTLRLHGAGL